MRAFDACRWSRLLATLGAIAMLLWASPGRAFCREVTETPPIGYDPVTQGCFTGSSASLPGLYWRNWCVSYDLQKNASKQLSLSDVEGVARQAFATWENAECADAVVDGYHTGVGNPAIYVTELQPVSCDQAPSQEHNNPIIFRDDAWPYDSMNALGYTTLTVDLVTGEILGAAIEINTSPGHTIVATEPPAPGAYDLLSILTHEAGHFLGLAHSADSTAVMYALYKPSSTALTPDDVEGICNVYNPTGARNTQQGLYSATSCNPAPRLGFRDDCGSLDSGVINSGVQSQDQVGTTQPLVDAGSTAETSDGGPSVSDNANVPEETLLGCTMGEGGRVGNRGLGVGSILAAALGLTLARRARRRLTIATGIAALVAVSIGVARDARASVSVAATFDDLVARASAAAVIVPADQRSVWEDGRIMTYTFAHVDRLVAGKLPRDIWVRTFGGSVGRIGQLVEGEATFTLGKASLVFLHPHGDGVSVTAFGVVEGAQGQFPIVTEGYRSPHLVASARMGGILPSYSTQPLARVVLVDTALDDAASAIGAAWANKHAGKQEAP